MLAEKLNRQIPWAQLADFTGNAQDVEAAIADLLGAENPAICESAYWRIENRVVVQGTIYQAACPATRVLVSALADPRPEWVRVAILDLLFQILSGSPDPAEEIDLSGQCNAIAREGLLLIVHEFMVGQADAARDVLELLACDFDYEALL